MYIVRGENKKTYKILVKRNNHLRDISVDERIILTRVSEGYGING
jgi:hypothetical protein